MNFIPLKRENTAIVIAVTILFILISLILGFLKNNSNIYFSCIIFLLGSLSISVYKHFKPYKILSDFHQEKIYLQTLRISDIIDKNYCTNITLDNNICTKKQTISHLILIGKNKKGGKNKIIAYISNIPSNICIGDSLNLILRPKEIKNFSDDFDYENYMAKSDIYYYTFLNKNDIIKIIKDDNQNIVERIYKYRRKIFRNINNYKYKYPSLSNEISILAALTTGDKSSITKDNLNIYTKTSSSHILAISGLHCGIIYWILNLILSVLGKTRNAKILRNILLIIFIWLFCVFSGMGASTIRAATMITIYELGEIIHRRKNAINALLFTAILLIAIKPNYSTDLSFIFSFSAMLGIIIFTKIDKKIKLSIPKFARNIVSLCLISLTIQLLLFPLSYPIFKTFNPFFMITNLIVIPITSIVVSLAVPLMFSCPIQGINNTIIIIATLLIKLMNIFLKIILSLQ